MCREKRTVSKCVGEKGRDLPESEMLWLWDMHCFKEANSIMYLYVYIKILNTLWKAFLHINFLVRYMSQHKKNLILLSFSWATLIHQPCQFWSSKKYTPRWNLMCKKFPEKISQKNKRWGRSYRQNGKTESQNAAQLITCGQVSVETGRRVPHTAGRDQHEDLCSA